MRLNIAAKIGLGFGLVTVAVIVNGILTSNALQRMQKVIEITTNVYTPSRDLVNKLGAEISDSRMLVKSWVYIDKISDTQDKRKLKSLHTVEYPALRDTLNALSMLWNNDEISDFFKGDSSKGILDPEQQRKLLDDIEASISDTLFKQHQYIMDQLSTFESYDDPLVVFEVTPMTEEGGDVMLATQRILDKIEILRRSQDAIISSGRATMITQLGNFRRFIFIMLIILALVSIVAGVLTLNSLANPINRTKNILLEMGKGILPKDKLKEGNDEIGQMSKALNLVVQGLKNISDFTVEIGKGNFDTQFKPLSEEDTLGQSLLEMREELKKAKDEEEKRQEEIQQRNWSSQGVALFSDILRKNNDNLENLTYEIISNMVRYTNSNQGGIFIVNDNDREHIYLEMKACYAFDRQKFLHKQIEVGEGLVGRCYQEQEKIFLTDIPDDYIKITSGLGDDNPKCLLLIPLAYNDNIYGIMEIASFTAYKDYEIEFIERIGESIAATISSVKSSIQTTLLLEQSQQQAEEMSSQEEEMRQNMEELRATQEQSARREEELSREVEALRKQLEAAKTS